MHISHHETIVDDLKVFHNINNAFSAASYISCDVIAIVCTLFLHKNTKS